MSVIIHRLALAREMDPSARRLVDKALEGVDVDWPQIPSEIKRLQELRKTKGDDLDILNEHIAKLKELEKAGVDQFCIYLMCGDEERNLTEYCEKILPHFAKNKALA